MQKDMIVIGCPFQPHVADKEGEKEVRVAVLVESEVQSVVVAIDNPADYAPRDCASCCHVDCSDDKLVEFVWPS